VYEVRTLSIAGQQHVQCSRECWVRCIAVAQSDSSSATLTPLQALLPHHYKLSSALDPLHHLSHAHRAAMRATAAGQGAGASDPSWLPPVPGHLDTEVLAGG
jgi:hypothetical protein